MLAERLETAASLWGKFMGLMGRSALPSGDGLWLPASNGIHMMFMRFPIDVVFLGRPAADGGLRRVVAVRVGLCFAATAAMRWLSRQEPLLTRLGLSKIGLVAGGSLLSAVLITLTLFWVDRASGRVTEAPSRLELVARLAINLTMLANWCALYFGYQLIRERNSTEFRAMQAESLALKNELEHLQGQISPHFLFNALNTVLACRQDPEAIDTVTQALANYLRFLLRPVARLEPLSRELDALEQYLTVQAVDRRSRIIRRTMAEWEEILPAGSCGRISRSLIVQFAAIRSTKWQSRDQTLVFFKGVVEPLPIGRAATTRLKDLLPS